MPKFRREAVIQDLDPSIYHYLIPHRPEDDQIVCVCASLPQPRNTNKGANSK